VEQRTLLVRKLRRDKELSLDEIARDTQINVSTVSRMERGLIPGTPEQRAALAEYFGRPVDELFSSASAAA
jgi:transcriptional regulator with XRE-family HTH domain